MSLSSIPAVLDAIYTGLAGDADLTGVKVTSGPVDPQNYEYVMFSDVEIDEMPYAMGHSNRIQDYTISGELSALAPGAGEDKIQAARDRAFALWQQVSDFFETDPTLGALCQCAEISAGHVEQTYGMNPEGRICRIDFTVRVRATF